MENMEQNLDFNRTLEELEEFNATHIFVQDDDVLNVAKNNFKIEYLFPWQRLVISNILDSYKEQNSLEIQMSKEKDLNDNDFTDAFCLGKQIVLLPTGAGKSMCFLVPAIMLPGPTLIIYPLLALMSDQERRMKNAAIESVTFKGGQTEQEREENFRRLKNGAKIILANPEVLKNQSLIKRLKQCNISHIAIDESHCVAEWGDTFRPAYLELGNVLKQLEVKIVTAFTATASPKVLERISQVLFENNSHIVRSESDRPNIHYFVKYALAKKLEVFRICKTAPRPILIFCGTRRKAEDMAFDLAEYFSFDQVRFYHAGLSPEEKKTIEKWYFPNKNAILCTTCAFGMGVDKPDIRTVIHLEPSTTVESYIQEAGRAGRDRKDADAILLWNHNDSKFFDTFPKNSRQRIIKEFALSKTCRRQVLLNALGAEQAVCSGCDVCNNLSQNKKLPHLEEAFDSKLALKFIKFHQREFSKNELIPKLKKELNSKELKYFGYNIWTENDVKEIVSQLEEMKMIKESSFPWKNKVEVNFYKMSKKINV